MMRLLAADYRSLYGGRAESPARQLVRAPLRFITNPSLHAVVMIRAALGGPVSLLDLWRQVLLAKHSIDLERGCQIGPGLNLPHPFGIVLTEGVRIGAQALIYHNVSLGGIPQDPRLPPRIGDRVVIHANSMIAPGAVLGSDVIIAANSFVEGRVPDRSFFRRGEAVPRGD